MGVVNDAHHGRSLVDDGHRDTAEGFEILGYARSLRSITAENKGHAPCKS
jgi:hypothetical protein